MPGLTTPENRGTGPLEGIRVLDFSRVLAGPHCGRMLRDLGAEVIKVEPPEGDLTRTSFPRVNSIATYFTQQNCGKLNVSLDLKNLTAVELLLGLVDYVDIVVENFRPGVMERMGLDYVACRARNPRIVYGSLTGYGHTGPWRHRRAYAAVIGAESGFTLGQTNDHSRPPVSDPFSHADVYAGLECLSGILAALYQRDRTGAGQWVEVSMAETMISVNEHVHWDLRRKEIGDGADQVPSFHPGDYPVLVTGEGHSVVVSGHPADQGTFERYMRTIGRPDLIDDERFASVGTRRRHLAALVGYVSQWAAAQGDLFQIERSFEAEGLAMGVLRTVEEIAETEWAREREAVAEIDDRGGGTVRIANSPWHFSESDTGARGSPAYRGEHNREVFGRLLGVDDARLDELEAAGVLSSRIPR